MSKNLYIFLIIFLGLTSASIVTTGIISLQVGPQMYTLNSYTGWFLAIQLTASIGSILLLKYYYYRGYRFAFFAGIIAAVANISNAAVVCIILLSGGSRNYYMMYMGTLLFSLCAIILYAVSLTFSKTRERFWLKLAGVCSLVVGLVLVSSVIGGMDPKNVRIYSISTEIARWATVAGGLLNLLFIMNFLDEIKALKTENADLPKQRSLENLFGFATAMAVIFTIVLGTLLAGDSHTNLFWRNYNAEEAQGLVKLAGGASTFTDSKGNSLHYVLIKPQDYDPQKKYPLVVCLPYGGYEASAAELLTNSSNRKNYPAFIFVPYCPDGEGWGGIPGVRSLDSLVYKAINAQAAPGIDVKRRYVTGVSRGAYGSWQFICTQPDMFAAAVPVSGGGDPKLAPKAVHVAIWAFHGAKDRNVPVSGSRDMIAAVKKAGGHPQYTEYPDADHSIWDQVSKTPGLLDWLFAQKRE